MVSWGQLNIFDHVIMVSMTEIHKLLPEGNIFKYSLGKRRKKSLNFFLEEKHTIIFLPTLVHQIWAVKIQHPEQFYL